MSAGERVETLAWPVPYLRVCFFTVRLGLLCCGFVMLQRMNSRPLPKGFWDIKDWNDFVWIFMNQGRVTVKVDYSGYVIYSVLETST